jgi:hypothetical protein
MDLTVYIASQFHTMSPSMSQATAAVVGMGLALALDVHEA